MQLPCTDALCPARDLGVVVPSSMDTNDAATTTVTLRPPKDGVLSDARGAGGRGRDAVETRAPSTDPANAANEKSGVRISAIAAQ